MTLRQVWPGVLVIAVFVGLIIPARADTLKSDADHIVIGVGAVVAAIAVVTIVLIHRSKKHAITGCISSGQNGMVLTDERDSQVYTLSGYRTTVKRGERMKLRGKKLKPQTSDQALIWETASVEDLGACRP